LWLSVLAAVSLAYLAIVRHLMGPLLWPAVAVHAVVAILLAGGRFAGGQSAGG
jgi:hypothetical protein